MTLDPTIHASAVLVGAKALLIRGVPGSGKSRLALRLIQAAGSGFARLVGDDRVHLEASSGRLLVRPATELAGLIEVRGLGIRRLPYESLAVVGMVVDLAATVERLPEHGGTEIAGITLPRLELPTDVDPLPAMLAALATSGI